VPVSLGLCRGGLEDKQTHTNDGSRGGECVWKVEGTRSRQTMTLQRRFSRVWGVTRFQRKEFKVLAQIVPSSENQSGRRMSLHRVVGGRNITDSGRLFFQQGITFGQMYTPTTVNGTGRRRRSECRCENKWTLSTAQCIGIATQRRQCSCIRGEERCMELCALAR
jgi:hypothetical protein